MPANAIAPFEDIYTDQDVAGGSILSAAYYRVQVGTGPPSIFSMSPSEFSGQELIPSTPSTTGSSGIMNGVDPVNNCLPSYPDFCIPPPPPILNCEDISGSDFTVIESDPHGFDQDDDGIGCEDDSESDDGSNDNGDGGSDGGGGDDGGSDGGGG